MKQQEREKEVLFLRASKSLLGWNSPFLESQGCALGSPGSGFQRPVSTEGRGTKGSLPARTPTVCQAGSICPPPNLSATS